MTWYVEGMRMRELFLMDGSSVQWHHYYVTVGVLVPPNLYWYIDYSRRTTVLARRVILGIRSASSSRHCYQVPGTIEDAEYLDLVVYLEPGTVDDSKCSFWCHQLISIWHAAALVTATYGRSDYTVLPFFIVRHWFHGDDRDGYFYHIYSLYRHLRIISSQYKRKWLSLILSTSTVQRLEYST